MGKPIKSETVTAERVREQFAHTSLRDDPTDVIELPGSQQWPASLRERLSATLKPAGVLIPLFDRPSTGLTVLLTQRSAELRMHAGQVSFPGGRMEGEDADIAQTALRETFEEVGLAHSLISVVGYLPPMPTITGYAVTPVIGMVDHQAAAVADRQEVEFVFEVPLDYFLDNDNRRVVERDVHGKILPMIEFHFEGHRIWGATAMMIIEFTKILNK
jgi:8-oxo-dGTP pyrophosphatase MutT (NUDIX family)